MTKKPVSPAIRTAPVQQRSAERIELLLDAAAELIAANGIDGLTTSDVAAKSHSSVGVVYRYFPNIQSLLRALAARNLKRFTDRVSAELAKIDDWRPAADRVIEIYVEFTRKEPGFRALHFGDVIDERFLQPEFDNHEALANVYANLLSERYGFEYSEDLVFQMEVLHAMTDALLIRAFYKDPKGDERFIEKAHEIVRQYISTMAQPEKS